MKVKVYATIHETFTFYLDVPDDAKEETIVGLAQDEANEQSDDQIWVPRIEVWDEKGEETIHNGL